MACNRATCTSEKRISYSICVDDGGKIVPVTESNKTNRIDRITLQRRTNFGGAILSFSGVSMKRILSCSMLCRPQLAEIWLFVLRAVELHSFFVVQKKRYIALGGYLDLHPDLHVCLLRLIPRGRRRHGTSLRSCSRGRIASKMSIL